MTLYLALIPELISYHHPGMPVFFSVSTCELHENSYQIVI